MLWLRSPEFKVGVMVFVVSGLIAGMAAKVAHGPGLLNSTKHYYFRADSAGGLVLNSAVKMAGIKIGTIDDIVLEHGRAKIVMALQDGAKITDSARVEMRSDGILGDKHIELVPGKEEDPDLPPDSEVVISKGRGGMDDVMADVGVVAKGLKELIDTLNKAVKQGDDTTTIGRIVGNIEKVTADLRDVTAENKEKISQILDRVKNLTKNIDTYINEDSLAKVDKSVKNIAEITDKINKGQGTLGRLINDDSTIEGINTAIDNVNQFLGTADRLETGIDFHSELMSNGDNKTFLGVRLQPGSDRYYEIDVISSSIGYTQIETDTVNNGSGPQTSTVTKNFKNQYTITALFAKNFYDFTLKGGLIESFGGFGADYYLLNKKLRFSAEIYNFTNMQVRAFARYTIFQGLYAEFGGDNMLSKDNRTGSVFGGVGLYLNNDDLKLLAARLIGAP